MAFTTQMEWVLPLDREVDMSIAWYTNNLPTNFGCLVGTGMQVQATVKVGHTIFLSRIFLQSCFEHIHFPSQVL